jgi:adenosylcobinamide amidohydrolase
MVSAVRANDASATLDAAPFTFFCAPPFLTARFPAPRRTLGWSMLHPGFSTVREIVWVEVRNRDLGPDVDAFALLRGKLVLIGLPEALAFMTSRDIRRHHFRQRRIEDIEAACLTTVGLSNGERIGARKPVFAPVGTINTLVHVSRPLTDGAFVEAVAIAAQARTAAILETRRAEEGPAITGTGTDCIVVAAPCEGEQLGCAGLHTAVGEAIGAAVYDATCEGVEAWAADNAAPGVAEQR